MNSQVDETYYDGLHEECGVFGVYDLDGGDVTMDFSLCSTEVRKAVVLRSAIQKDRKEKYCLQKAWDLSMKSLILKNLKNSKEISGLDMSATRRQVRAMDRMYSR